MCIRDRLRKSMATSRGGYVPPLRGRGPGASRADTAPLNGRGGPRGRCRRGARRRDLVRSPLGERSSVRIWMPGRSGRATATGAPARQAECSPAIAGGSIRMDRRSSGAEAAGCGAGALWPTGSVRATGVPRGRAFGTSHPRPPRLPGWEDAPMLDGSVAPAPRRGGPRSWLRLLVRDAILGGAPVGLLRARIAVPLVGGVTGLYIVASVLSPEMNVAISFAIVPLALAAVLRPSALLIAVGAATICTALLTHGIRT